MSTVSVRLPGYIHQWVKNLAEAQSVSMNQLITLALSEKLSALLTEEYLQGRAKQGSRRKFRKALNKVARVKPEEEDSL